MESEALLADDFSDIQESRRNRSRTEQDITPDKALRIVRFWINSASYKEQFMPLEKFQFWYDVISEDNHILVKDLLLKCTRREKNLLLNGHFQYQIQFVLKDTEEKWTALLCKFELPLHLAVYYQSRNVLKVMFESTIDILQKDVDGNNLIHDLVLSSSLRQATDYRNLYDEMMSHISIADKEKLLLSDNDAGLRPLEYASQRNEFGLVVTILNTQGVYAIRKGCSGVYEQVYYDVTDYECVGGKRHFRSPLWYMTHATDTSLERQENRDSFVSPVINAWHSSKKNSCSIFIWFWFFFRAAFHILVFVVSGFFNETYSTLNNADIIKDYYRHTPYQQESEICTVSVHQNYTECDLRILHLHFCKVHNTVRIGGMDIPISVLTVGTVLIACCLITLIDIVRVIYSLCRRYLSKEGVYRHVLQRGPLVNTRLYTHAQSLLALSIIGCAVCMIVPIFLYHPEDKTVVSNIGVFFFIAAIFFNIWAMLYFFQFLPHIGYFMLAVHKMVGETLKFFVIFLLFLFGFSEAFTSILYLNDFCEDTNFEERHLSLYSTFTVMLNMKDFGEYVQANPMIGLVHLTFIMLVGVLMLNFLIALMGSSMSQIQKNKAILINIQRLHISLSIENTLSFVCRPWFRLKQRQLLVREDDRLYLPCLIVKKDETRK